MSSFASSLDALSGWRKSLVRQLDELGRFLNEHELADPQGAAALAALRERLGQHKLLVAFVAEFSRGKSELINAIFFADTGRRVLPATPGRTTMCPVELAWDPQEPAGLSLLPIETRLGAVPLADLRDRAPAWTVVPFDARSPDQMVEAMREVTHTHWVSMERARDLGFWDDEHPQDNPPLDEHGQVEVPAWRHALINYPHPLLEQSLVVLDTPGLNAIGAEPELTLGLLPTAHATVFILAADAGVTRSDLSIWREHLGADAMSRFVVLNKIDSLADPLASPAQVEAQIESQCADTARMLGVAAERVFPLSARQALAARVAGDADALQRSRLPRLEEALAAQLMPQRRALLERVVLESIAQVESQLARRLAETRRQLAEQMLELRGLRGKSSSRLALMIKRIDAETTEFEQCTSMLQAMRSVHSRMLKDVLGGLANERLREEVGRMQTATQASLLNLGAKKAFVGMCERLRAMLEAAEQRSVEIRDMLAASFTKLNAEFGFSLAVEAGPALTRFGDDLKLIEANYAQYLGLKQALRLSQPKFMEQMRRMLISKLRVVFEGASAEIELWNKNASAQVDAQLRERRLNFTRRREALERVQSAAGELQMRLDEIEAQEQRLQGFERRAMELIDGVRSDARSGGNSEFGEIARLDRALPARAARRIKA